MSEVVKAPTLLEFRTGVSLPDAIGIRLSADDGTNYTVRIRRGQIAPLIVEILGQADRLPPESDQRQIEMASLSAIGVDTVVDSDGHPGISIRLAGGLRLTLSLTASAIADLQNKLANAQRILRSGSLTSH
jgi:hypothetical protein